MKQNLNNLKCPSSEDLIAVLVDNEGSDDDFRSMKYHIDSCERCMLTLTEISETRNLFTKTEFEPFYLSRTFTAQVMDEIDRVDETGILDDIFNLSRRAVSAITIIVFILLSIMFFPYDGTSDNRLIEELVITNGVESEVLGKDEITHDDVVTLLLTQR